MKTKIFISAISMCFFVMSCKKNNEQPDANQQPTNELSSTKSLASFDAITDEMEQRMYFDLTTNAERIEIVSSHVDYCLKKFTLTTAQKNVLANVKLNLSLMYGEYSVEQKKFKNDLEHDIKKEFDESLQTNLIFNTMIDSDEDYNKSVTPNPDTPKPNCSCSSVSNFCSTLGGSGPSIKCDKTLCGKQTTWGCGSLFQYGCNGKCSLFAS